MSFAVDIITYPCSCVVLQGNAGIGFSMLIIIMTICVALIAALSAIGVCERCKMERGGVYFLLSHVLGARIGASVGIIYCFGQVSAWCHFKDKLAFSQQIWYKFLEPNLWTSDCCKSSQSHCMSFSGVSNHRQLECLSKRLFWLTTKIIKALHYWPFVRGIHQSLVDSPHKGRVMLKELLWHNVIMVWTCHEDRCAVMTCAKFCCHHHLNFGLEQNNISINLNCGWKIPAQWVLEVFFWTWCTKLFTSSNSGFMETFLTNIISFHWFGTVWKEVPIWNTYHRYLILTQWALRHVVVILKVLSSDTCFR